MSVFSPEGRVCPTYSFPFMWFTIELRCLDLLPPLSIIPASWLIAPPNRMIPVSEPLLRACHSLFLKPIILRSWCCSTPFTGEDSEGSSGLLEASSFNVQCSAQPAWLQSPRADAWLGGRAQDQHYNGKRIRHKSGNMEVIAASHLKFLCGKTGKIAVSGERAWFLQ